MAKRNQALKGNAEPNETVADQIAEYVGRTMGELMNRRDALMKEVSGIDEQVAAVTQRLSSQLGQYLPTELPRALRRSPPGTKAAEKALKAGKAGSKRQRGRTFTPEQRAEAAARMRAYWARLKGKARRKRAAGGTASNT